MLDLSKLVIYPDIANPQVYHGCINIKNQSFEIKFSNPSYLISNNEEKKHDVICEMDGKLSQILYHCEPMIEQRLLECKSPEQFINEVYNILYKTLDISSIPEPISSSFYCKICRELDIVGWQCIKQISSDMTQFILNTKPNKNMESNQHELYVKIVDVNNFPNTKPFVIANRLPLPFEFEWTINEHNNNNNNDVDMESSDDDQDGIMNNMDNMNNMDHRQQAKYNHIANVIKQYNTECKKYKTFWKIIEDFYENSIVLEPQKINYGCNTLRLLLDKRKKTTIEIRLNPDGLKCQNEKCECNFYGIKEEIIDFQQKWKEDEDEDDESMWDVDVFPRINIEQILDIQLINDENWNENENENNNGMVDAIILSMECSMCLEFKNDEDEIPNVVCKACKQSFHKSCLLEWFNSLDTINHHYTSIDGKCPHCDKRISFEKNRNDV